MLRHIVRKHGPCRRAGESNGEAPEPVRDSAMSHESELQVSQCHASGDGKEQHTAASIISSSLAPVRWKI